MKKGTHPRTIPARFGVIWFSCFRGKDLNVIFYQNMPNNISHFNLLLRNHWANCNQTLMEWSLQKLCPVIPTSNQDKKGNNSKMGNGIYFKITGCVDIDMLHIFAI
jgi:hypothetical protein